MRYAKGAPCPDYFAERDCDAIYEFDDFENLLSACSEISRAGRRAALFASDDGRVCLQTEESDPYPAEFSGVKLSAAQRASALEHSRRIDADAGLLGSFAVRFKNV